MQRMQEELAEAKEERKKLEEEVDQNEQAMLDKIHVRSS